VLADYGNPTLPRPRPTRGPPLHHHYTTTTPPLHHHYTTTTPRTDAGRTIYRLALKLTRITTLDEADHETGRPALYDNAIDTDYTHSIGIQKGQI